MSSHEPILGLALTSGNSVNMKENVDQMKGVIIITCLLCCANTLFIVLTHSNSEDLHSRRVSLGNIPVDPCILPYTHDPITHSLHSKCMHRDVT